jgi:hypothetical protein
MGLVVPGFDSIGNLPTGIPNATMAEVEARFAHNDKRRELFNALERVIYVLRQCNCPEVYLDGNFITAKDEPDDYDLCYEPRGIVATDRFRKFLEEYKKNKEKYLGDIFVHLPEPPYRMSLIEFWQKDARQDDVIKGILRIDLGLEDDAQK